MANAAGGPPPYQYQWEDGYRSQQRRVCVMGLAPLVVALIAQDAKGARSEPNVTELAPAMVSGNCQPDMAPGRLLCLRNPSFEGAPSFNVGGSFDAPPWARVPVTPPSSTRRRSAATRCRCRRTLQRSWMG
jgi:hypothetical protein